MKKRNIMMFSVLVLVVALIAGGTMAWFTAEAEPVTNLFEAGTVEINLLDLTLDDDEEQIDFPEEGFGNVNPGDNYNKLVRVENVGSKTAYVRIKLTPEWTLAGNNQFPQGFTSSSLAPAELDGVDLVNWVLIDDYYYYKHILVGETGITTDLFTNVVFDGPTMVNAYQGASFELTVEAEAIQATNGAIEDLWGIDPVTWVAIP